MTVDLGENHSTLSNNAISIFLRNVFKKTLYHLFIG